MDYEILSEAEKRGHEQVIFFAYPEVGLKALVAVHSTVLGPGLGGCRMRLYDSEAEASEDVMRLAEGMSYKNAIAGLDLGGAKACLIVDPHLSEGREALFKQFGKCLNHLGGRYISAEDMGTTVQDVMWMREETKHACGFAIEEGGAGDPSPWTALGVYRAILAGCERVYSSKDLTGKRVTVQGVGHVGLYIVEHLVKAGATVTVCDTHEAHLRAAKEQFNVDAVGIDEIYDVDCDVFSPCAIGQTVNPDTIPRLKCKIIAGAANNQLLDSSAYSQLSEKGITYLPDFVINSGGVIAVGSEVRPEGYDKAWVQEKVDAVYDTTHRILEKAANENVFPEIVAVQLAKDRIKSARKG